MNLDGDQSSDDARKAVAGMELSIRPPFEEARGRALLGRGPSAWDSKRHEASAAAPFCVSGESVVLSLPERRVLSSTSAVPIRLVAS